MGIAISQEVPETFKHPARVLHLWQDPSFASDIEPASFWVARKGQRIVGSWLIPLSKNLESQWATRETRVLPYSSPWLVNDHIVKRRKIWRSLLEVVQKKYYGIELPMEPNFIDIGAISEAGCFVEARHTHVMSAHRYGDLLYKKAIAHARCASKKVTVIKSSIAEFPFDKAIIGETREGIEQRRNLALKLDDRGLAFALTASSDGAVGGILGIQSAQQIIIMHSWFDRDGPRGVPTLLLLEAANFAASKGINEIDLEGSIISSVDRFMDSITPEVRLVPHIHWARSSEEFNFSIRSALNISGR